MFQDLINNFHKLNLIPKNELLIHEEQISNINNTILNLLIDLKLQFESQLIGSKTFCAGSFLLYDVSTAIKKITNILHTEKLTKSIIKNIFHNDTIISGEVTNENKNIFNVCLCFALLESNIKIWSSCDDINVNNLFLDTIFPILENISYTFSSVTLLSFKCLVKMFEILNTVNLKNYVIPDKYILRIVNIIMSNWENPLNGVREQNCLLFEYFLLLTNKMQWISFINKEMVISHNLFNSNPIMNIAFTHLTWMMKCKYFILSSIINYQKQTEVRITFYIIFYILFYII